MNNFVKKYVFKLLLCVCMLMSIFTNNIFALDVNDFYVQDKIGYISQEVKECITKVNNYYKTTNEKPQIVVDIVNSLNGETIESYTLKKFEDLKLGNANLDNGVLLVISTSDKSARIEVGYGLEGALTDSLSKEILNKSTNYLKAENYNMAVKNIFDSVVTNINKEYGYTTMEKQLDITSQEYGEYKNLTKVERFVYSMFIIVAIYLFIRYDWFRELVICMLFEFVNNKNGSGRKSNPSEVSKTFGSGGRSGGGGASVKF